MAGRWPPCFPGPPPLQPPRKPPPPPPKNQFCRSKLVFVCPAPHPSLRPKKSVLETQTDFYERLLLPGQEEQVKPKSAAIGGLGRRVHRHSGCAQGKNITCQTCELFLVAEEHHFQRGESGEGMEGGGGGEVSRWGGEGSKKQLQQLQKLVAVACDALSR